MSSEKLLRYVGPISLADGTNRGKVQVFRTGTFYHPLYKKFTITDEMLEVMEGNFKNVHPKSPTELVVDYEHMSERDATVAPAAGWVKALEREIGALYLMVEWTDEAAELIRDKKYRFISPVWNMNYVNKATGKPVGPALLAVALTNRPFIEGMDPVVLSESIERSNASILALSEKTLFAYTETSADDVTNSIRQAYYVQFPEDKDHFRNDYVSEIYDAFVIVEEGGELFKLGYTRDAETGTVTFDKDKAKVTKSTEYTPVGDSTKQAAEWDREYINDLPDTSFAYIEPDGEKDEQGKTVPRALRHLPFKTPQGNISIDHLRNALARLDQTTLPPEAKAKARAVLEKAAEEAGVGEDDKNTKQGEDINMEEKLRELLGLGEDDDIVEAVTALKAKVDEAEAAKTEAETETAAAKEAKVTAETNLKAKEVASDVDQAVRDGKLLPAQVDWAKDLRAKDPAAFKTFLETAKAGPSLDVKGKDNQPADDDIALTGEEAKSAKILGVDPKDTLEQKKKDAAAAAV